MIPTRRTQPTPACRLTRGRPAHVAATTALLIAVSAMGVTAGRAAPSPAAATGAIPQPALDRLSETVQLAPEGRRVDLRVPCFTNSTRITNPLFPISELHSAVLLGNVGGRVLRVETTLLPGERTIDWMGQSIRTRTSQYIAYLDGRIEEAATDWYAQSDDGAVWYLGENVFNYEDGVVGDHEGTWLAGDDGPIAMIMPARPRQGDVYRAENSPGIAFEQVEIRSVNQSVEGPYGAVRGAVIGEETHMEGDHENKVFAPGYGEFASGRGGDLEALAIAVPVDARPGPAPAELDAMLRASERLFDAARSGDWAGANTARESMQQSWRAFRDHEPVPALLGAALDRALGSIDGDALVPALGGHNPEGTCQASIAASLAVLDLLLRHREPSAIDSGRFGVWARRLALDAAGTEAGAVAGDVAALEWIRGRIAHTWKPEFASRVNEILGQLRTAADAEDLAQAAAAAARLRGALAAD